MHVAPLPVTAYPAVAERKHRAHCTAPCRVWVTGIAHTLQHLVLVIDEDGVQIVVRIVLRDILKAMTRISVPCG